MSLLPTVDSVGDNPSAAEMDAAEKQFMESLRVSGGAAARSGAGATADGSGPGPGPTVDALQIAPARRRVRGDSWDAAMTDPSPRHQSAFAALSWPQPHHTHGSLVAVSSYSCFADLAHGPRGTEASRSLRTYRLNIADGTLTLLYVNEESGPEVEAGIHNPAFTRSHPSLNVVYTCTESVKLDGEVHAYAVNGKTGALKHMCPPVGAGGTSTCYLTIHKAARRMLLVNYWDSTICTLPIASDGTVGPIMATYDPKQGREMKAKADTHVNHSRNDAAAQAERQGDPHSHAIVLDPADGNIAYVPDLGMDLVRQFYFNEVTGEMTPCGEMVSGIKSGGLALGPRYISFLNFRSGKDLDVCYVVNELSSQVAVFSFNRECARNIASRMEACSSAEERAAVAASCEPTLNLIQTVSTVPEAFPRELNTCGRVCVHPSGDFVVTSNRGHDSICVHRVHCRQGPRSTGMLTQAGIFHTRGETPRHFQFDHSGQWLVVANQDSDTIVVFNFNVSTGVLSYTGNEYACPSPNFVCVYAGN